MSMPCYWVCSRSIFRAIFLLRMSIGGAIVPTSLALHDFPSFLPRLCEAPKGEWTPLPRPQESEQQLLFMGEPLVWGGAVNSEGGEAEPEAPQSMRPPGTEGPEAVPAERAERMARKSAQTGSTEDHEGDPGRDKNAAVAMLRRSRGLREDRGQSEVTPAVRDRACGRHQPGGACGGRLSGESAG
jgi:hypothetical protein